MNWDIVLYIAVGFVAFSFVFYCVMIGVASNQIYIKTLKRRSKDQWGRQVSIVTDETLAMDKEGLAWQSEHNEYKKDVHIVNNGLNLYGEYYDMGFDKAVVILSGRTESLRYGYYFAKPYSEAGFNILVIDPRAHGLSDGEYNTVGFEESKDALAWVRYLHEEHKVKNIVYHGICIGAAAGILGITSEDCPSYLRAIVTEGMFPNFNQSMRNNLIDRKRLMFPVLQCIDAWMKKYTGHSMKYGPIDVIGRMDKPILMLQSKLDRASKVENAIKMYNMCPSKEKKLVLFETGEHSMLRITHTEKYDKSISDFLQSIIPTFNEVD